MQTEEEADDTTTDTTTGSGHSYDAALAEALASLKAGGWGGCVRVVEHAIERVTGNPPFCHHVTVESLPESE